MFILIITVLLVSIFVFAYFKRKDEELIAFAVATFFIGAIFSLFPISSGITDYGFLVQKKQEVISLRKRIDDIKKARYPHSNTASFVNGSIENFKQSTILSEYIKEVVQKEAKYNGYLSKCKAYKDNIITIIFADGFFISDKIDELDNL